MSRCCCPIPLCLALWLVAAAAAFAEEAGPWWVGQPLALVSLEAPDGGLPGENLEPLLNARQGKALSPRDVRADLAMLVRVGQFAAVEAHVEPWVGHTDEGIPVAAVRLVYRVEPPPRIRRIRVQGGPRGLSSREVEAAAGLAPEDPFFAEQDIAAVTERIERRFVAIGHPFPEIEVSAVPVGPRLVDVVIRIREGPVQELLEVNLVGLPPRWEERARRILRKQKIDEGRSYTRRSLVQGRESLRSELRRRGYPEATVKAVLFPAGENPWSANLTLVVETGPRYRIETRGAGLFGREELLDLLDAGGVGPESPPDLVEDLEEQVVEAQRARGYLQARAEITVQEEDQGKAGTFRRVLVRVKPGPRHRLAGFRFEGADAFEPHFLEEAMREAMQEAPTASPLTPRAIEHALHTMEEYYRSQGYLSAELRWEENKDLGRGLLGGIRTRVDIRVWEGPRTVLREIRLEGDRAYGEEIVREQEAELLDEPFNPAAVEALARQVVEACREHGYLHADARARWELGPESRVARVILEVEPGPQVHLRNIIIQGHQRTRRSVIEREVELRTGEPVTASAVARTRRQLYDLELFRAVDPQLVGDQDRVKDLVVKVEEYRNISMELGGGGSTDEGVRAFLRTRHRNLWGRAHRLSVLGQVGLGYQGDAWRLDSSEAEWRAAATYEAPNLLRTRSRGVVDLLLNETRQHPTYRLSRMGAGLGLQSPSSRRWQYVLDYRVEWRRLEDVDPGALVAGDPWLAALGLEDSAEAGVLDADALEALDPPSERRPTSGPGLVVILDDRDDPQNPRKGVRWTTQIELHDDFLTENAAFLAQTHGVRLFPLGRFGLLLGASAGVGRTLQGDATLPLEDRFRLGGAGSLRGFKMDTVGPRNRMDAYDPGFPSEIDPLVRYARREDPYRWVATGGDTLLSATAELKVPLSVMGFSSWEGAALVGFADAGNVWLLSSQAQTTTGSDEGLRVGVGMGFRYATPVGPLQLDLGFNPDARLDQDEAPVRLHLSLGTL